MIHLGCKGVEYLACYAIIIALQEDPCVSEVHIHRVKRGSGFTSIYHTFHRGMVRIKYLLGLHIARRSTVVLDWILMYTIDSYF